MFGVLFSIAIISGVIVSLLGNAGFYRMVFGRRTGSMDHDESHHVT